MSYLILQMKKLKPKEWTSLSKVVINFLGGSMSLITFWAIWSSLFSVDLYNVIYSKFIMEIDFFKSLETVGTIRPPVYMSMEILHVDIFCPSPGGYIWLNLLTIAIGKRDYLVGKWQDHCLQHGSTNIFCKETQIVNILGSVITTQLFWWSVKAVIDNM